ncbi:MAG: OmpH family outer membrane protein [Bacteroides sp.]|nr:OmpH family outer membrane protein [Bacteroidales bacterium]MBD5251337.1 OmpH family outer membrane protein [Barnesiella sp.]MBD5343630.1 OmpH family outer membrane protein [Bacteroides sp.]MDE5828985.1 OmpH family outer membrane protein [Duncaniella sp.]MBD5254307.1 OmpH family outer membrane protein [Barnesiella sp.]
MFKRLLIAILIALPMTVFAQKYGVINTQTLLESMPEIKQINEQLQASSNSYQEEFNKLTGEFQKKFEEFQALSNDPATPQTIKDRRTQEMQELENKIQQFRQTADQDLQRQQQQLMAPLQEKVMKAIQSVGEDGGYTFIFENVIPVYTGKDVTDVTETVKALLVK